MEMPRHIEEVRGGQGIFMLKHASCLAVLFALLCGNVAANDAHSPSETGYCGGPKYVILFIGDGMGFEQVKAAGMYENGGAGTLSFESFPHRGEIETYSSSGPVTDSAAVVTAMATGRNVSNGAIRLAIPGDKGPRETVLESFKACGRSAGLVSTAFITHATPAAFAAHESDIRRSVLETVEFERAVRAAYEWAAGRANTVTIIVTADHETGGLSVIAGRGKGAMPDVKWSTHGHTGVTVPVYAWGLNAALINGAMENTGIFDAIMK